MYGGFMKFGGILLMAGLLGAANAQPVKNLTDASINTGDTLTLHSDTTYLLTEKVFVEDGAVLKIEAGTLIKGQEKTGDNATALIICRGGKIYAQGTKFKPIIFTTESDNLGNLTSANKGLWGGVVILGKATTNEVEAEIEGIATGDPRALFGGTKDDDTSGVLKYVSIRHSGATIAPNNELNGLSLGGVGSGTVLEYVEAYASSDDGFEWVGGTVNGKHLGASFCDDDGFDIDQGYRGNLQFLFAIQDSIATNMNANWAGEWDGDDTKGASPFGLWTIHNATFIGGGSTANTSNGGIIFKANAGAKIYNSIFSNFKKNRGIVIEDLQDSSQDSRKRFESGDIVFKNNLFWGVGGSTVLDSIMLWNYKNAEGASVYPAAPQLADSMKLWGNLNANPMFSNLAYGNLALDPRLSQTSPAFSNLYTFTADAFFKTVNYKGAFGNDNWITYWTALWDEGIAAEPKGIVEKIIRDNDIVANSQITFHKDTVYVLTEKVFVESGAVLTIEAGTVIKGDEATGDNASALIICRGAKIIANGTAANPIIFTAYSDNVTDPSDLTNLNKGLWGGVVILGNAITNEGEAEVEGIATGDPRSKFGGAVDADSSGILRFVSIRHSGATIAPNNELNGLSLAGVGSKTVLEYVECFASSDDGFEWWGGSVNGKYLIASFCDDDGFDIDQGFRGNLQFILAIQDSIATNMNANWAGEWDGDDTKGSTPFAQWTIANATFIGGGATANSSNGCIHFKANGAAKVYNSVFSNFKKDRAIVIEDLQDSSQDSRKRFEAGNIVFKGNIFWAHGTATVIDSAMRWYYKDAQGASLYPAASVLTDSLKIWANTYVDPAYAKIAYGAGSGKLDLRLTPTSPSLVNHVSIPGTYFEATDYKGAFKTNNWADSWSALSSLGFFAPDFALVGVKHSIKSSVARSTALQCMVRNNTLRFTYSIPKQEAISLNLFSITGKRIATLSNRVQSAGTHLLEINAPKLASGTYVVHLKTATSGVINSKFIINK
jgi:hypothetical protein